MNVFGTIVYLLIFLQINIEGKKAPLSKKYVWDFENNICKMEEESADHSCEGSDAKNENKGCIKPTNQKATCDVENGVGKATEITIHSKKNAKISNKVKTNYNVDRKDRGLDDIACVRPEDSMEQFIQEALLNPVFYNSTIIGQGRQFLSLVYKALLKLTVQPFPIRKEKSVVRLISKTNNLKFMSIDTYSPKDFKSIYEEDESAIYYPYCANHPDMYHMRTFKSNYFIGYSHKLC